MARPDGAKKKLLNHFLANIGRVMDSTELRAVAGSSEWGRRTRELRDEQGYQILTHNDRADLKPSQYVMISAEPKPSAELNGRSLRKLAPRSWNCMDPSVIPAGRLLANHTLQTEKRPFCIWVI